MHRKFVYKVENEMDFWSVLKGIDWCQKNVIYLENDIVFHEKRNLRLNSAVVINGQGHSIFYPQDSSFEGSFLNTTMFPYRQCIKVKKAEDLEKIRGAKNGTCIVEFLTDIEGYSMDSIELQDFDGSLILLGNHHMLRNMTIYGEENNGLIGYMKSCSSLRVKNLFLNQIYLVHSKEASAGFILGNHGTKKDSRVMNVCSPVIVKNCSIVNSKMDDSKKSMGIIMGNYHEELYVRNCNIYKNALTSGMPLKSLVGGQEIFDGYYYESENDKGPMLKRKLY